MLLNIFESVEMEEYFISPLTKMKDKKFFKIFFKSDWPLR